MNEWMRLLKLVGYLTRLILKKKIHLKKKHSFESESSAKTRCFN